MRKTQKNKSSKWQWYSVKLLFECIISAEAESDTIDENYTNDHKTYEESIVLVKAQSFKHAYKIAEKKAKEVEIDYTNPYGELVTWKFVDSIDCFSLIDENFNTGVELYSRFLRVPKNINTKEVIQHYYPETIEGEPIDYNFILRNRDFNLKPNSKDNVKLLDKN